MLNPCKCSIRNCSLAGAGNASLRLSSLRPERQPQPTAACILHFTCRTGRTFLPLRNNWHHQYNCRAAHVVSEKCIQLECSQSPCREQLHHKWIPAWTCLGRELAGYCIQGGKGNAAGRPGAVPRAVHAAVIACCCTTLFGSAHTLMHTRLLAKYILWEMLAQHHLQQILSCSAASAQLLSQA
jgi:hypothetical protein